MRLKYLLFLLSLISIPLYAQGAKTRLIINTNSAGSYIFLDGKLENRGKLEIDLPEGTYRVCIKESLMKWTGSEVTDEIKISGFGGKIEKYYSLEKPILLITEPQNASVLYRDSLIGYTPLFVKSDIANVTLLKNNYGPRNINLIPLKTNEIDLGTPINGNGKSFIRSVWFKVLIGTAAVLGSVAAYYKLKADRRYSDYLSSFNPDQLNEVNRYDTISGVALGVLQLNFGVLLYFLLSD